VLISFSLLSIPLSFLLLFSCFLFFFLLSSTPIFCFLVTAYRPPFILRFYSLSELFLTREPFLFLVFLRVSLSISIILSIFPSVPLFMSTYLSISFVIFLPRFISTSSLVSFHSPQFFRSNRISVIRLYTFSVCANDTLILLHVSAEIAGGFHHSICHRYSLSIMTMRYSQ